MTSRTFSLRTVAASTVLAGALLVPAGTAMAADASAAPAAPAVSSSAAQHGHHAKVKVYKLKYGYTAHVIKTKHGYDAKIKYGKVTLRTLTAKHPKFNNHGLIITLHKNGVVTSHVQKAGHRG
ncbi:hypothetical protein [Streptomyces sp. ODS28]|uniref:hypothetical protein n=1 Tax=Streptomyces sp. ODS28 TaxID=3136688 RepID=UPI0031E810BE